LVFYFTLDNPEVQLIRMRTLVLLSGLAIARLAVAAASQPFPVEAFTEQQQYSNPRISPDGKHLAVNVRIKRGDRTVPTMTIYTLPKREIVSTIMLPGYELPVDFYWATNERLVVSKGLELGAREKPLATGEVVAVNLDGSKPQYLYGYKAFKQSSRGEQYGDDEGAGEIVHIPRSRNGHVLVGSYDWNGSHSLLYDINSVNSARNLVADIKEQYLDFVVQNDGKPRFAYGTDDNADPALYRRDDTSGEWRNLSDKNFAGIFRPFAFTPDDKAFYANYSAKDGPITLVREDLATGTRTVVGSDPVGNIDLVEYTAPPRAPFAVGTHYGVPKVTYLDESLPDAVLHKTLSQSFPGEYLHFINFTDDGQKLLFAVSSDRDPGSFYIFDKATGEAELLMTNMPRIDPDAMGTRKPVVFTARDGMQVTGYLTLPKHAAAGKLPMVVLTHGGPIDVNDDWYFDPDAQFLASRGYAVLQVNYRGSGGRGPGFIRAGYRQWGGAMIDDVVDGVKWAATHAGIDSTRVCAYGWSYGAYASLMLAAREPGLFKCAVGAGGVYYLPQMFDDEGVKGNRRATSYLRKTMGGDEAFLKASSPTELADKITVPVLLVHGGKDKRAPISHARRMREALTRAGHPPEWLEEPDEGHGFYDSERQKNFYLKLQAFLDRHIGH
jgi:dipeptidyl aminopeptidase/acylaminoacyl peptidase